MKLIALFAVAAMLVAGCATGPAPAPSAPTPTRSTTGGVGKLSCLQWIEITARADRGDLVASAAVDAGMAWMEGYISGANAEAVARGGAAVPIVARDTILALSIGRCKAEPLNEFAYVGALYLTRMRKP